MAKIHPGATLTPHFRDFLPGWLARQPWYAGPAAPTLTPIGYLRLEDPAGEVGMETHIVRLGDAVYHLPLTYRGAPLADAGTGLVATAEHSVLGTRWIYDAAVDPVWRTEVVRLVADERAADPSSKRGGPATGRGRRLVPGEISPDRAVVEVVRLLVAGTPGEDRLLGYVMGTWHPSGPDAPAAAGPLVLVRQGNR